MKDLIIDIHTHLAASKDSKVRCYCSKEFEKYPAFQAMLLLTKSIRKQVNVNVATKYLLSIIGTSKYIEKSVVCAIDETYDENGKVQKSKTHLFMPNNYIAKLASKNENILFGASVHPYRNDWSEELEFCIANNAVLCKWIPSSQMINPKHPNCIRFYKKLAELKLPLLCHTGPEYMIPTSDEDYLEYNNPKYLRNALDYGVRVIIAHFGIPYFDFHDNSDFKSYFEEVISLFEDSEKYNWNIYADISGGFATPLRVPRIELIRNLPPERILFGSDFPFSLCEFCFFKKRSNFFSRFSLINKIQASNNVLDKYFCFCREIGFDERIFINASKLFSEIKKFE